MVGVAMDDDDGYLGVGEKIILFIKGRAREEKEEEKSWERWSVECGDWDLLSSSLILLWCLAE